MAEPARMTPPPLSAARYLAGLQCPRRLWLLENAPDPVGPAPPAWVNDSAAEVRRAARQVFPGGVAAEGQAIAALLAGPAVPAIFDAVVVAGGAQVRVDVLAREPGGWTLVKVKGSGSMKDHYLDEVALQAHVLGEAGVALRGIEVMHLNTAYVRGPDGIDAAALFTRADVSAAVGARIAAIAGRLAVLRDVPGQTVLPFAEPGRQCDTPYSCGFWPRCASDKPKDWVRLLPRLTAMQAQGLAVLGVEAISAIPADFPLDGRQAVIRDAFATGRPYIAADLPRLLHRFAPPACYLDFEAMMPPIPLYAGTRPFQTLPFQWSLHHTGAAGTLTHQAFLAPHDADPRRAFAETLIAALAALPGPVIVYSPFEQTQLRQLAAHFPDLAAPLGAIIARLADLLPVVRGAVYFPAFGFSNSIKAVAPALSSGFSYDDLTGIADGAAASAAFAGMASGSITDPAAIAAQRRALLAYCERDTLAMVVVHRALQRAASQTDGGQSA